MNIRAHSDPTHQHFGPPLPGHHLQNSYTQTGSLHTNDNIMTNSSVLNSSLHNMVCSSAMDCESPVTSTTGLALQNYQTSRFPAKIWAPITPPNSLQSPPNSLQSPLYHHSTHSTTSSHHMRLNNVSHANGTTGSNSQHSTHHSRTGPFVSQPTFRQNRQHVNHSTQHTPQHTSNVSSIGKSHQHLAHSAPSLQVAAISSSCPSATSTSSHQQLSALVLDALSQSSQKCNSMISPPSSGASSVFSVPMDTSAGEMMPAFIQNTPAFQSLPTFQATAYQPSGQSVFKTTNILVYDPKIPNATVSPKHSVFNQVTHPSLASPAISTSTLTQQQRQTGLVESVLKRSRQSYASEETDSRDDTSPMVHNLLPTGQHSIGRPPH